MSGKRFLAALVAGLLVAASCGGSGDDDAGGGGAPDARGGGQQEGLFEEEESGIGAELAAARAESPDGLLPTEVALDLFASIYGEVPGGRPRFDEVRPGDASLAIRAVGARWDDLTEDTRAAIRERVGSDGADDEGAARASYEGLAAAFMPAGGGAGDAAAEAELLARVERLQGELAQHLGITQQKQIGLEFVPGSTWVGEDEGTRADAAPLRGGDFVTEGEYDLCQIRLNEDFPPTDTTLAHEVFHCLQFEMTPLDVYFAVPDWIVEGSAAWAAVTVAGADRDHRDFFVNYQQSTMSLYTVDYEAAGYFWTVESIGINPWDDIPRLLSSGNRGHDAHHPVLDRRQLVSRMGTGAFMSSADGASVDDIWDLTPDAVPSELRESETVSRGSPVDFSREAPEFSRTRAAQINVDGDALDVELGAEVGAVQEVGGPLETFEGTFEKRFCFDEGDAHIVFMNLAFVDPGTVSIKLSVPSDDEDCEEDETGCPGATIPPLDLPGLELRQSVERTQYPDCLVGARQYRGPRSAGILEWTWAPGRVVGPFERLDPCSGSGRPCEAATETFPDGSGFLEASLTYIDCTNSAALRNQFEWAIELRGEARYPLDGGTLELFSRAQIQGFAESCGGTVPAFGESVRAMRGVLTGAAP